MEDALPPASTGRVGRLASAGLLTLALVQLAACAMPQSVASYSDIRRASEQGQIQLIPVTAATLPPSPHPISAAFPASFSAADEVAYDRLGPGDRLNVKIWEGGTPTVFPGGSGDLGEITVDESGRIYLPYVGAMQVSGMTAGAVRAAAARRLSRVVANPQIDIRPVEQRSKLVSVQGDATKTGSFAIDRGRTRLGELLAEVAPNQENPEMLNVTVRRAGQAATVRLSDIYDNAALDIALQPGDSVVVSKVVQNITVLGAAGIQGQVKIPERDFTLVGALGQARGLNPEAADPRAVYVMRARGQPGVPPLVYHFDMRRPDSVALANRFIMRNNDAILISSAPFAQTRMVLSAFAQTLNSVRSATLVGQ